MKYWQQFLEFDYAYEILLAVGGLLVVVAILQIVRSSIKMLFWVLMATLGAAAGTYGLQKGPYTVPGLENLRGANLNTLASTIDSDVLQFLCQKLDGNSDDLEAPPKQ